jgi:RNA polymerase sigma factor (sigma-70 family)
MGARAERSRTFERLYRDYRSEVLRLALRDTGNRAEAEDVAQAAFLDAYRAIAAGRLPEQERPWLLAVTRNRSRKRFRARQRRPLEVPLEETIASPDDGEALRDADELRAALRRLPKNQRAALFLREVGGLSYQEVAERLGVSVQSVQMLLFRAKQTLRRELGDTTLRRVAQALALPLQPLVSLVRTLLPASEHVVLGTRAAGVILAGAIATGIAIGPGAAVGPRPAPLPPTLARPAAPAPAGFAPTDRAPGTAGPTGAGSAPSRAEPVTAGPITGSPVTAGPITGSPVTDSPVTGSPVTADPVTASPPSPASAAVAPLPAVEAPAVPEGPAAPIPAVPVPALAVPSPAVPSPAVPSLAAPPLAVPTPAVPAPALPQAPLVGTPAAPMAPTRPPVEPRVGEAPALPQGPVLPQTVPTPPAPAG